MPHKRKLPRPLVLAILLHRDKPEKLAFACFHTERANISVAKLIHIHRKMFSNTHKAITKFNEEIN